MVAPKVRQLRTSMTDAERKLWRALRSRGTGAKFRRQVPLRPYIVDFACFEPKLIVEVDGGQHLENARDVMRDKYFENRGYCVLRYWNNEVHANLDGVLMTIAGAIDPSPGVPQSGTPPSPSRGEGNSGKATP